jgi:hypothetical protein
MVIYADIARFVVIEKAARQAALSNNVYLSRIAKEVMCLV